LKEIWFYTQYTWNISQAKKYTLLIEAGIEKICKEPLKGRKYNNLYYFKKVKHHYIFYRIQLNHIEVDRVLHEKMDIGNILNE
jgi:toxin ParE1/3/4